MLVHRLRRRPNIGPTLGGCVVSAGEISVWKYTMLQFNQNLHIELPPLSPLTTTNHYYYNCLELIRLLANQITAIVN